MDIILASILGYLIGSIPFALVVGKVFYKVDVREHGSGNLGGSNAGRVLGAKAGVTVAVGDVLKATIAMTIAHFVLPNAMLYAGLFATLGHCFPVYANFKGGKAVSTAVGFLLGISIFLTKNPLLHFVLPIVIFFILLYITKVVSLSSIIVMVIASIILWVSQSNITVSVGFTIVAAIVIYRHKGNLQRIKDGTERKITWM